MIEEIIVTITPILMHIPVTGETPSGRPHILGHARLYSMIVAIKSGGQVFERELPIEEDDLISRLDFYIDHVKEALRKAIKESARE